MNLLDYIKGQRRGKDANAIERASFSDPFLRDAIDGFDSVKGDHLAAIRDMQHAIYKPSSQKGISMPIIGWIVAACLFIGVLGGGYQFLKPAPLFLPENTDFAIIDLPVPENTYAQLDRSLPVYSDIVIGKDVVTTRDTDGISLYPSDQYQDSEGALSLESIDIYVPNDVYDANQTLIEKHNANVNFIIESGGRIIDMYIPDSDRKNDIANQILTF